MEELSHVGMQQSLELLYNLPALDVPSRAGVHGHWTPTDWGNLASSHRIFTPTRSEVAERWIVGQDR